MKKAQNLIEVSLILVLVVAVSLSLWPMFNNQKTKLAELSKSNVSNQSISGRQVQLKNNVLGFASDLGVTINNPNDTKAILDEIKKKIDDLSKNPNPDASQLALLQTYTIKYKTLSNEQASLDATAVTMNDNPTIGGATGGKLSDKPVIVASKPEQQSSVSNITLTGHNAYQLRPGQVEQKPVDATGTVANDDQIESSQYAIKTKP